MHVGIANPRWRGNILGANANRNFAYLVRGPLHTVIYYAMLQLSCKSAWIILLKNSSDTNYVLHAHEILGQYRPYAVPQKTIPWYSFPVSLVDHHSIQVILTSSSGTNYVFNEHAGLGKYGPYATLAEIMPIHSYHGSLMNWVIVSTSLFGKIMTLINMKIRSVPSMCSTI